MTKEELHRDAAELGDSLLIPYHVNTLLTSQIEDLVMEKLCEAFDRMAFARPFLPKGGESAEYDNFARGYNEAIDFMFNRIEEVRKEME